MSLIPALVLEFLKFFVGGGGGGLNSGIGLNLSFAISRHQHLPEKTLQLKLLFSCILWSAIDVSPLHFKQ